MKKPSEIKGNFNKCNKIRRKNLAESKNPNQNILGINYGNRNLKLGSYNVDTLRTNEAIESLLHNLNQNNIDIACIQETHNESIEIKEYENYIIIYGGCAEIKSNNSNLISRKAGVAIAVKKKLKENISNIQRINERIITIVLKTDKSIKDIKIINSYAPHHGYEKEEQEKYWNLINNQINNMPDKYIKCWCTDNNGQISQNIDNKNNVGKWTIANNTTEPNGTKLEKYV